MKILRPFFVLHRELYTGCFSWELFTYPFSVLQLGDAVIELELGYHTSLWSPITTPSPSRAPKMSSLGHQELTSWPSKQPRSPSLQPQHWPSGFDQCKPRLCTDASRQGLRFVLQRRSGDTWALIHELTLRPFFISKSKVIIIISIFIIIRTSLVLPSFQSKILHCKIKSCIATSFFGNET